MNSDLEEIATRAAAERQQIDAREKKETEERKQEYRKKMKAKAVAEQQRLEKRLNAKPKPITLSPRSRAHTGPSRLVTGTPKQPIGTSIAFCTDNSKPCEYDVVTIIMFQMVQVVPFALSRRHLSKNGTCRVQRVLASLRGKLYR